MHLISGAPFAVLLLFSFCLLISQSPLSAKFFIIALLNSPARSVQLPDPEYIFMGGCKLVVKKKTVDWVEMLLKSKFFGSCDNLNHRQLKKNVFCIDCNLGFCRLCVNLHRLHRCLQICKYVYRDVLRLQDIHKHLDCSKIQTYKINGEKAVHLNPRPQSRESKPSTKLKTGATCQACGRYLQDQPNRFCSIACKVSVAQLMEPRDVEKNNKLGGGSVLEDEEFGEAETSTEEKKSSISWADFSDQEHHNWSTLALKPTRKRFFKRKGVPRRAPFR